MIIKGLICYNNIEKDKPITIDEFIQKFNWRSITPFIVSKKEIYNIFDFLIEQHTVDIQIINNLKYVKISNSLLNPHISLLNV